MASDVLYFQVGALDPIINKLPIKSKDEIYNFLGFKDHLDFVKREKCYEKYGECAC